MILEDGSIRCWRRRKRCRSEQCKARYGPEGRKYPKGEYNRWECPECGLDRHCMNKVLTEGAACDDHGGASLKGSAAPSFKHGRHSKYNIPEPWRERMEMARNDPQLLSLHEDVAAVDMELGIISERLWTGEFHELWPKAQGQFQDLVQALSIGDRDEIKRCISELNSTLKRGGEIDRVMDKLDRKREHRRRLVATENKRLADLQAMITVERALMMLASLVDSVIQHVTDPVALSQVNKRFLELTEGANVEDVTAA